MLCSALHGVAGAESVQLLWQGALLYTTLSLIRGHQALHAGIEQRNVLGSQESEPHGNLAANPIAACKYWQTTEESIHTQDSLQKGVLHKLEAILSACAFWRNTWGWNAHVSCLKSILILRTVSWQDSTIVVERKVSSNPTKPANNRKMPTRLTLAFVIPPS